MNVPIWKCRRLSREKGELSKRAIRMEEIDDLVVKMLDVEEAKASFPTFRRINDKDYEKVTGKRAYMIASKDFAYEVIEWFVEQFGFPNNTHVDKEEGAKITPNKKVVVKK